jgi:hypothetical protein
MIIEKKILQQNLITWSGNRNFLRELTTNNVI